MKMPTSITRAFGTTVIQAKKNSPHLFFGAGVVGVAVSTVMACRATLKLEKELDEIRERAEKARVAEHITESERPRVLAAIYAKGLVQVGVLYLPSAIVGTASVACLTGSHVQLSRRNAALASTLTLVTEAYENYRERVREEVGEEKELDIYRGVTQETREIDGKKQVVRSYDPNRHSVYARCFDSSSWEWKNNAELNRIFLQHQQSYLNQLLHARGWVMLNEVYHALGLEETSQGAVVGWASQGNGDCYISFDIFEPENARFVNGEETNIWLDFNVDGLVYDLIDSKGRR